MSRLLRGHAYVVTRRRRCREGGVALPVSTIRGRISAMLDVEPAAPLPEDACEWLNAT